MTGCAKKHATIGFDVILPRTALVRLGSSWNTHTAEKETCFWHPSIPTFWYPPKNFWILKKKRIKISIEAQSSSRQCPRGEIQVKKSRKIPHRNYMSNGVSTREHTIFYLCRFCSPFGNVAKNPVHYAWMDILCLQVSEPVLYQIWISNKSFGIIELPFGDRRMTEMKSECRIQIGAIDFFESKSNSMSKMTQNIFLEVLGNS